MGLQKLLPRSIRMASFYVKAKGVVADQQLSNEQKMQFIKKKERAWIGDISRMISGHGIQDTAVAIGIKDMAKIYLSLGAPDDALRYLDAADKYFPKIVEHRPNDRGAFDSYILAIYYKGKAFAQKDLVESCFAQFDKVNIILNNYIRKEPSNSNLQELYKYINQQIFKDCREIREKASIFTQSAIEISQMDLLYKFEFRDPGNEQILEQIQHLKTHS